MSDDDRIWLETLAGERVAGETDADREAADLRRAMQERATDETAVARRLADPRRVAELLDRARRAGVTRARPTGISWFRSFRGALATAAVCVVVIGVGFELNKRPSRVDETVRSASPGVLVLTADEPLKLRDQIVDELESAGLSVRTYESLGREGIDADVPESASASVLAVLDRHGLRMPADRVLRIEVVEPAP